MPQHFDCFLIDLNSAVFIHLTVNAGVVLPRVGIESKCMSSVRLAFYGTYMYGVRWCCAVFTVRPYTITTKTASGGGTDAAVFITMFDASGNTCVETELDDLYRDDFESGA